MKYSVPYEDDEQNVFIDIRFFPNEATDLIYLLLSNLKEKAKKPFNKVI